MVDCPDSSDEADCGEPETRQAAAVRAGDHRFMSALPSFPKGKRIQASAVPGCVRPPHRLRRHLELSALGLHLPVPRIQVAHLAAFTCRRLSVSATVVFHLLRFGDATQLPARPQDSPFTNITVGSDGSVTVGARWGTRSTWGQVKAPEPEESFLSKNHFFVQ